MPVHETPEDRARERAILDRVEALSSFDALHQMPLMYALDAAGERGGKITRLIEVKDRSCLFGEFEGGLFVSANKLAVAMLLRQALDLPTSLLVRFSDGALYHCNIEAWDRQRGVFWWGRDDGRDGDEDGPTVAYPWDAFTRLDKDDKE